MLAVGDAHFRNKCYKRISGLRLQCAVIFVSHNMEQVGRICDIALALHKGSATYMGDIGRAMQVYAEAGRPWPGTIPGKPDFRKVSHPIN